MNNFALIGSYGLQMTVTFAVALAIWTLKVMVSSTDTIAWYKANTLRIGFAVVSFWLLAVAMVILPNISALLGLLGFNADQSTAAIALVITGYVIKKTSNGDLPPASKISDLTSGAPTGE